MTRKSPRTKAFCGISATLAAGILVAAVSETLADDGAKTTSRYLPEYAASGEIKLPKDFHEWVYVGSPLTPNALDNGKAAFPEYHNVCIEPGTYAIYKKTNVFPEDTVFVMELQLTLPGENPDGSRTEPSGRGYFPDPYYGAEVAVKNTNEYATSGG